MKSVECAALVLALAAVALATPGVRATPLPTPAIVKLCAGADGPQHCERLIEIEQMKQFPGIASRDGAALRLGHRAGGPAVELKDVEEAGDGAAFRGHAFWDYWPKQRMAIVSVTARDSDYFLVVDLERRTQTRVGAEPVLAPGGEHFLVADLCETRCGNVIELWRFDADGLVKSKTLKPLDKWYNAEAKWRDATTVTLDYGIAGPEPKFNAAGERIMTRTVRREVKLSDWDWIDEERKR
jgi:hypothetical protein